jgi:hypothetical protein
MFTHPTITATDLKALKGDVEIGEYELHPHFLVKIFNIAEENAAVKEYLQKQGFYSANKRERLDILKRRRFFHLLTKEERSSLIPLKDWNRMRQACQDLDGINGTDIRIIKRAARQFQEIDEFLEANDFYHLYQKTPLPIEQLKEILSKDELSDIMSRINSEDDLYFQYVNSESVKNETDTGVCVDIDMTNPDKQYDQPLEEEQTEGHWKLHIGIDMEKCGQEKIDIAYNIVLKKMQEYEIHTMKLAAPYADVNSMKGKEFTAYLNGQIVVPLSPAISNNNIQQFIIDIEKEFIKHDIVSRETRDLANKEIKGSIFFSYRNERSRVLEIDGNVNRNQLQAAVQEEAVRKNYFYGYAIVIYRSGVYFIKDGKLIEKDGNYLRKGRDEMKDLDISLEDGDYFPAVASENLAKLLENDPYNPFSYQDIRFGLNSIDIYSDQVKHALRSKNFIEQLQDPMATILYSKFELGVKTRMPTEAIEKQLFQHIQSNLEMRQKAIDFATQDAAIDKLILYSLHQEQFANQINDPIVKIFLLKIQQADIAQMSTLDLEEQFLSYVKSTPAIRKLFINNSIREVFYKEKFIQSLNDLTASFLFSEIQKSIRTRVPTEAVERQLFNYVCSPGMQSKLFMASNSFFSREAGNLKRKLDKEEQYLATERNPPTQGQILLHEYQMQQGNRKKQKVTHPPKDPGGPSSEPPIF